MQLSYGDKELPEPNDLSKVQSDRVMQSKMNVVKVLFKVLFFSCDARFAIIGWNDRRAMDGTAILKFS